MTLGERYCQIIEQLPVPNGLPGDKLRLAVWQRDYITRLFSLDEDRNRIYRRGFLYIPKKSGKTTLIAAILIAFLLINKERGKQTYSMALSREQASIIFRQAEAMIEADEFLSKRFNVVPSKKLIIDKETTSTYQALSKENKSRNGLLPSLLICDECAEYVDRAVCDLYEKLESGMIGANEPLTIYMTTAGIDRHGLGFELYQKAKQVNEDPNIDPTFLTVFYETVEDDPDWRNIDVWKKVNPGWGTTINPREAQQKIREAEQNPGEIHTILRYHLNVWLHNAKAYVDQVMWDSCQKFNPEECRGKPVWIGIDLAATTDTTCAVIGCWQPHGFAVIPRYYIPEITAVKRWNKDGVNYPEWIKQGHIIATCGDVCDYNFVLRDIKTIAEQYDLQTIGVDPWNANQILNALQAEGFRAHEFRQGMKSYAPATHEFERLLASGKFLHNDHPVLSWNARNVVAKYDENQNVMPSKDRSREKIDGFSAAMMSLGMSLLDGGGMESANRKSVYEGRGVLLL